MIYGTTADYLIIARFLSGVGGAGAQMSISLYFSEIANDNIRGKLATSYPLMRNSGVLFAYVAGIYMNYIRFSCISAGICIMFVIAFYCVPSTPKYLFEIGADDVSSFHRNIQNHFHLRIKCVDRKPEPHLNSTKAAMVTTKIQILSRNTSDCERFPSKRSKTRNSRGTTFVSASIHHTALGFLLRSSKGICFFSFPVEPVARKSILIGIVLTILTQSCGVFVFITYASSIFAESGANISIEWSSISLALLQMAGTLLTTRFVETQGRKPLLIFSLVGCMCGLLAMAAYVYCDKLGYDVTAFYWIPVTSLSGVIFVSSVGIVPLALICLVEALPTKVRSFGLTVGVFAMGIASFVMVATYPFLLNTVELHGCMVLFASTCLFGIFFVAFVMDETKGKTLDLSNAEKVRGKARESV